MLLSSQVQPQRPLTARADMRRGVTINPRRRLLIPKWGDTPGPAGYTPRTAGDLAIKVGDGKDSVQGIRVHDALCLQAPRSQPEQRPYQAKICILKTAPAKEWMGQGQLSILSHDFPMTTLRSEDEMKNIYKIDPRKCGV